MVDSLGQPIGGLDFLHFNFTITSILKLFGAVCISFYEVELRDLFKQIRDDFNGGDLHAVKYVHSGPSLEEVPGVIGCFTFWVFSIY